MFICVNLNSAYGGDSIDLKIWIAYFPALSSICKKKFFLFNCFRVCWLFLEKLLKSNIFLFIFIINYVMEDKNI